MWGKNEKMQKLVSIINFDVFQQQNESLYIYKVAIYLFNLLARDRAEDFQKINVPVRQRAGEPVLNSNYTQHENH